MAGTISIVKAIYGGNKFRYVGYMFLIDQQYWQVKTTVDKGRGVFVRKALLPGLVIGDYIGRVIRPEDEREQPGELNGMSAHDNVTFLPKPSDIGIHLINHSCMPNCGMYPFEDRIVYFTLRKIFPGEELSVSYMVYPSADHHEHAYPCFCHTPLCTGTMTVSVEKARLFWDVFVKQRAGQFFNHVRTPIGEILHPLARYPTRVIDFSIFDIFGVLSRSPIINETSNIPAIAEIRKIIRKNGKQIWFKVYQLCILGVKDDNQFIIARQTPEISVRRNYKH